MPWKREGPWRIFWDSKADSRVSQRKISVPYKTGLIRNARTWECEKKEVVTFFKIQ